MNLWEKLLEKGVWITWRFGWTGGEENTMDYKPQRNRMTIDRLVFTDKSTIGELKMDNELFCYTLEDTCREAGVKIYGKTAIPAGLYEIRMEPSHKFGCDMPFLFSDALGIGRNEHLKPGDPPLFFSDVMLHPLNFPEQTEGCVGVGMRKGEDAIWDAKRAFGLLLPEIQKRLQDGPLFLAIYGGRQPATVTV